MLKLGRVPEDLLPTTEYFRAVATRPDRAMIREDWIRRAIERPIRESIQGDGRVRRWVLVPEAGG